VQTKKHGVYATMKKDEFGFLLMNLKKATFTTRATICPPMANKTSVFFSESIHEPSWKVVFLKNTRS
jgi:hypothetical protein